MRDSDQVREQLDKGRRSSFLAELGYYLRVYRKWWLVPLIIVLLLFGALVIVSESAAAPFIYSLF